MKTEVSWMGINEKVILKTEVLSQILFNVISSSEDITPTQRVGWGERETAKRSLQMKK